MGLHEQFRDLANEAYQGYSLDAVTESCVNLCRDKATDFLDWYLDRGVLPRDDHKSVMQLWDEFKTVGE